VDDALPDPRILRTRRDVVDAAADLLVREGWEHVTHAAVAGASGYAKATVYAHWPTRLDLVRDAVDRMCDETEHPAPTGDLRADLVAGLTDFAEDLAEGRLGRVLGGLLERSGSDPVVDRLRTRLYDTGTSGLRGILAAGFPAEEVEEILRLLTGAVLMRVSFEGRPAERRFVEDLVDRVLGDLPASDGQPLSSRRPPRA
jgi:AcrR family transcriptional regulator